jgi:hypothetical protein
MSKETKRKIAVSCLGKNLGRRKSIDEITRREASKAAKRLIDRAYGQPRRNI